MRTNLAVSWSMPITMLDWVDATARILGTKRNRLIRKALESGLPPEPEPDLKDDWTRMAVSVTTTMSRSQLEMVNGMARAEELNRSAWMRGVVRAYLHSIRRRSVPTLDAPALDAEPKPEPEPEMAEPVYMGHS